MRNIFYRHKALMLLVIVFFFIKSPISSEEFEYKLKAEFIERFTRFIDWPASSSVPHSDIPFDICITGTNPFGEYLTALARNVKIKNKLVRVRDVSRTEEIDSCNVLFISKSEASHLPAILEKISDRPILSVADTPGYAEKGVLINFYRSGNYVRFEINSAAVQKSGLRFSSRLLKLARLVDTPPLTQESFR
ncbi:MAG TPA: YfiR family protein [Acidobacteriota bacterium]|nr:YfiR family protein [Acidobacteriota bacterium]